VRPPHLVESNLFFKRNCSGLELSLPACLYFKQLLTSFREHPVSQNLARLFTNKQWLGKPTRKKT